MFRIYRILYVFVASTILISCGDANHEFLEADLHDYKITIDYDRPTVKSEDAVANIRSGGIWNLGATDRPVIFTTTTDLRFGAGYIKAGEYSLWAQRGIEDHWFFIFNKGVESVIYDQALDIAVLPVNYRKQDTSVDRLSITLTAQGEEGNFIVQWGSHRFDTGFVLPPIR